MHCTSESCKEVGREGGSERGRERGREIDGERVRVLSSLGREGWMLRVIIFRCVR